MKCNGLIIFFMAFFLAGNTFSQQFYFTNINTEQQELPSSERLFAHERPDALKIKNGLDDRINITNLKYADRNTVSMEIRLQIGLICD